MPKKEISTDNKKFLLENYKSKTDVEMAEVLDVSKSTIYLWRKELGLSKHKKKDVPTNEVVKNLNEATVENIKNLTIEEKRLAFLKQLRGKPLHEMTKKLLNSEELALYETKYLEYATSPDIETLTAYEEDDLHELTMTQISKMRLQKEEYLAMKNGDPPPDISRALKDKDETILKLKKSLDIERSQRLKRQEDSATNFITLIKEFNKAKIRDMIGREATSFNLHRDMCLNELIEDDLIFGIDEEDLNKYARKRREEKRREKEKVSKKIIKNIGENKKEENAEEGGKGK